MKRVSDTQTSLLSFGFKRTRKGDDTSSSSDFTEPEYADQYQDRDDECEDYNILDNYRGRDTTQKVGGGGSVKKTLYVELINKCKLNLQLLESLHNATFFT